MVQAATKGETSLPRKIIAGGVRVGSALASAPFSVTFGAGTPVAAAIGAGGDLLAQAVEENSLSQFDPVSLQRAGVEGTVAAVPFGSIIKTGKPIVSAIRSGLLSGAGEAGREYAAGQDLSPGSIGLATGLGAATGGLITKWMDRTPKPAPPPPPGPHMPIDFIKKSSPEQIESSAKQSEALAVADPANPFAGDDTAHALRVAAVKAGRAGEETKSAVIRAGKATTAQEAKNLTAADKAVVNQNRAADEILEKATKEDAAQQRWIESYNKELEKLQQSGAAANIEVMEAQAKRLADEAAATRVGELKQGLEPQPPVVKESYSTSTADGGKETATITHRPPAEDAPAATPTGPREPRTTNPGPLEAKGVRRMTADRTRAVTGMDPEDAVARGVAFKDGDGYLLNPKYKPTAPTAPAAPEAPPTIAPKEGVFQVVRADGKIIEVADAETANTLATAAGKGTLVIPPPAAAKAAKAKPIAKKASDIMAERAAAKTAQEAPAAPPVTGPKEAALKDTTTGTQQLEQLEAQLGKEIPPPPGGKGTLPAEPPPVAAATKLPQPLKDALDPQTAASVEQALAQPQKPLGESVAEWLAGKQPPADVPPVSGVKLSSPLAFKVAQAQGSVPEGSAIARFFRTPEAANKAAAYTEELPEETIGLMNSLLGRAEVAPPQPKGMRKLDDPGGLWGMIRQISKELELPQFPRGSNVKPNFKHVPEGMRPTPPAAPVIDATTPPKAAVKAPTKLKAAQKVAKTAPEVPAAAPPAQPPVAAPAPPTTPITTSQGVPGIDVDPRNAPLGPAQPIPAQLQAQIDQVTNQQALLRNSGRGETPEAMKLAEQAEQLQLQRTLAEHPELAAEMAAAEQAAKAKPKGRAKKAPAPAPAQDPGPPRLVKKRNPETGAIGMEAMMGGTGALGGALIGGAMDPLGDPFASAVMGAIGGAGLGLGGAKLAENFSSAGITPANAPEIGTPNGMVEAARKIGHLIPHFQRFNYLMSGIGLPANAIVGPYGSGFWGALTKGLSGDARGWAALKQLTPGNVAKEMWAARNEALEMIERAEAGDPLLRAELGGEVLQSLPTTARELVQVPARAMTTGDLGIRNILQKAGFSEEEARQMTLTAEPFLPSLKWLANAHRGEHKVMMGIMLPFVRTPANIMEQGAARLPGVGFVAQAIREAHGAAPMEMQEQLVGQTIGTIIGIGSYIAGMSLPPEQAQWMRRYITNAAGQYSLQASLGFAAGQSSQRGQGLVSEGSLADLGRAFPLPTADPVLDVASWASGNGSVPRNLVPAVIRDITPTPPQRQAARYRVQRPARPTP